MYTGPFGATPATKNPFIDTTSPPSTRYPDISTPRSQPQSTTSTYASTSSRYPDISSARPPPQLTTSTSTDSTSAQQRYPLTGSTGAQQRYPSTSSTGAQQRYPSTDSTGAQQLYPSTNSTGAQQLYPSTNSTGAQQLYPPGGYQYSQHQPIQPIQPPPPQPISQQPISQHQQIPYNQPPFGQQLGQPQIRGPQQPQNYPFQQQSQLQPAPQLTASFKPSSGFDPTLQQSSISGGDYSYSQQSVGLVQHQPLAPPQPTPYNPALPAHTAHTAQQQYPSYATQFDPYPPIPQGWGTDNATPQPVGSNNNNNNNRYDKIHSGPTGNSPSGDPHPRDYIHSHKQEIEAWDQYTWKRLLNSCEALKKSWETKRNELKNKLAGLQNQLRYTGYFDRTQFQQESGKIQGVS